jgi:hypothetical protein
MRRGLNITARALGLDGNNLRKRIGQRAGLPQVKRRRPKKTMPAGPTEFLELLAPVAGATAGCMMEVEAAHGGKLRMELKGLGTGDIAQLLHSSQCGAFTPLAKQSSGQSSSRGGLGIALLPARPRRSNPRRL